MSFLGEIKRRKVFKVAVVYAVIAWLLVQIIVTVESPLNLPNWTDTLVIVLVIVGFPVALMLAWALEITPEGTVRKQSSAATGSIVAPPNFPPSGTIIDSLAVLPFETSTHTPDAEYLSDGITETLINIFAELPQLNVVARSTVFRHKGGDPVSVGQDLGVGAVLTGRVFYQDKSLVIGAELIDVKTSSQLWGQQYRREIADIFDIQEGIAREISETLHSRMAGEQKELFDHRETKEHEAYQAYLRGRYYWNQRTPEGMRKAVDHFNDAIERDPAYASAYSGLGDAFAMLGIYQVLRPKDSFPRAKVAARRALEIKPDLGEAFATLGFSSIYYDWDNAAGEQALLKAIELAPQYPSAYQWYGMCLALTDRIDDAIKAWKMAQDLDPFSASINYTAIWPFYWSHRTDEAIEASVRAVGLHPEFWGAHYYLGLAYAQNEDFISAIAALWKAQEFSNNTWLLEGLGYCYARAGRTTDVNSVLGELKTLSEQKYVAPYSFAAVYAGLQDTDAVIKWLDAAVMDRSWRMAWLCVDPFFDDVRKDPRFQLLLTKATGPKGADANNG